MLQSMATSHSFWFLFGLAAGVVCTCILLLFMSILDEKPRMVRHKKEIEEEKQRAYELGRDWRISEQIHVELEIDELWYEIEDLKDEIEARRYDGLYADGKPIKLGGNDDDF